MIPHPKGRVVVVSIALDYTNNNSLDDLKGPIYDARELSGAMSYLSSKSGRDFYYIPVYQYSDQENTEIASINYPTKNNLNIIFNYLKNLQSSQIPGIYKFQLKDAPESRIKYSTPNEALEPNGASFSLPLTENDLLIITYQGHGLDPSGDLILADYFSSSSYPLIDLYDSVKDIDCNVLVIIDSCFSGNFSVYSDLTINKSDSRNEGSTFNDSLNYLLANDNKEINNNLYFLLASQYNQESYEPLTNSSYTHGFFTYSILNSLGWSCTPTNDDEIGYPTDNIPILRNNLVTLDDLYLSAKLYLDNYYTVKDLQTPIVVGGRNNLVLFNLN